MPRARARRRPTVTTQFGGERSLCSGRRRHRCRGEISARVLSARLRELQARGVVSRMALATSPPSAEYALTELGREFLPVTPAPRPLTIFSWAFSPGPMVIQCLGRRSAGEPYLR